MTPPPVSDAEWLAMVRDPAVAADAKARYQKLYNDLLALQELFPAYERSSPMTSAVEPRRVALTRPGRAPSACCVTPTHLVIDRILGGTL